MARDKSANCDTVCYRFGNRFPGTLEKLHRVGVTRRGATRRRGFPEDDDGWGYIRGIISCLVGFVGGKQSAQGCCRQTYYRRISYIHTRSPIALSKLLSLPQRRSRRDCTLRLFSRAPSVNSASLVHCDLFPKPRTTRAHPAWRIECTQPASCRLHGSCTYAAFHYCL